jgi:hypothetical protein
MTVYAVYEPPSEARDIESRADELVFVKEGFSWGALLIPGIWLIYRGMWFELFAFCLLLVLLRWVFGGIDGGAAVLGWTLVAIIVLFAFEANDLRGAALERRGYKVAGVATGTDRDSAELAFFRSWLPEQARETRRTAVPHANRSAPQRTGKPSDGEEVIGSFPAP